MNLVIDVGNTMVKFGVFDHRSLKLRRICIHKDFNFVVREIADEFPEITSTLAASVGNLDQDQLAHLHRNFESIHLTPSTPAPFINKYSTPETLGVDRIALVSAACEQYPGKNVLVVDAGTCITYDFVNSDREYYGGAISPGITLRYRSLHSFTKKLPLLEERQSRFAYVGDSTTTSIHSGVLYGVLYEIDGFIDEYKKTFPDLTVILTGGDTDFLRGRIKNDIFANSNFLLEGLNHILEFNKR